MSDLMGSALPARNGHEVRILGTRCEPADAPGKILGLVTLDVELGGSVHEVGVLVGDSQGSGLRGMNVTQRWNGSWRPAVHWSDAVWRKFESAALAAWQEWEQR